MTNAHVHSSTSKVPAAAVLEHLSGPSIGLETSLHEHRLDVCLRPDRLLDVAKPSRRGRACPAGNIVARLVAADGSYRLEACNDTPVWINGRLVEHAELINNDIIEFGDKGPLSRFRLIDPRAHSRRYFTEICDDCWDYLSASRKPLAKRLATATVVTLGRLAAETTLLFRFGVLATFMLLGFLTYQQYRINSMQELQLAASHARLEAFARTLAETRQQALTPDDLARLRTTLSENIDTGLARLAALEQKSGATEKAISTATPRVVFIQGAYGYRDAASGRVMRHVLDARGKPVALPNGVPLLSLDGEGPVAERTYTGTGFAIADGSVLVTNRHVAEPWPSSGTADAVAPNGLEPFMIKLLAYAPGIPVALPAELLKVSGDTDLALMRLVSHEHRLKPLAIARGSVVQGSPVIVMGYPTGLRSMVARGGTAFIAKLQKSGRTGFWQVAEYLAENEAINPLASLGIVAQLTSEYLVYDAATTRGGSGGPVLNTRGEVVAVNAAVLSGYEGSNFGVPVQKLRQLIVDAGLTLDD